MKRLFLSLAAIAALVSCVEEKGLEPQQPAPGQVTIKAVSADTKTLLDGTNVVWENNDAIKVVFTSADDIYTSEFTTELAEKSFEAVFTGTLNGEVTVDVYGETGYAVYPASVNVKTEQSYFGEIAFEVPAVQDGVVESGDNLSYAPLSLSDINATGNTEVAFKNALSLIRVTVPAGVSQVALTSDAPLAGSAPFYYKDEVLAVNNNVFDSEKYYTVTLKNDDDSELDDAKTYDVLVLPISDASLTISITGTDVTYEKTLSNQTFEASSYYTLNLSDFTRADAGQYTAYPYADTKVEVPVFTTADTYTVSIEGGDGWLAYDPDVKGSFRKDVLTFSVTADNTEDERTATVKLLDAGSQVLTQFTITQKAYVAALINDYIESYVPGYGQSAVTNKFSIEKSDDLTKGVYKIVNIVGGETAYADFEKPTLKIYDNSYTRTLTVSDDYSTMSSASFSVGGKGGYDGKYSAVASMGEAVLTDAEQALVGIYDESWTYDGAAATSQKGMEISASDEASYGQLKVRFLTYNSSSFTAYATLEGSTLSVKIGGLIHGKFGTVWNAEEVIELTVNDGTLTFASWNDGNWKTINNYTATKVVASESFDVEDLIGTYTQNFSAGGSNWPESTMEIQMTNDSSKGELKIVDMYKYNSSGTQYSLTCYANLEDDGQTLTVLCNGVGLNSECSFTENLQMIVSRDEDTDNIIISFNGSTNMSNVMPVGALTAIKN